MSAMENAETHRVHTALQTRQVPEFSPTVRALSLLGLISMAATPLGSAADGATADIDLSGSHRARYERLDPQYRAGFGASDTVLALQTSVALEAKWPRFAVVGEIMDARAEWNDTDSFVTGVVNTLEPVQAYAAWRLDGTLQEGSESSLRLGRMTIDIGKRRLLARSNFRHAFASFTGADWQWESRSGMSVRAFHLAPMRILPFAADELLANEQELDRGSRDTVLWGAYYLSAPRPDRSRFELTFLSLDSAKGTGEGSSPLDIDTWALRVFRPVAKSGFNYEVEGGVQRGESTVATAASTWLEHDAYYAHAEIGRSFDVPWAPNLLLQYDTASGDKDPGDGRNERFNTLYGERRFDLGPTGIDGPFQRANLASLGIRLTFNPAPRWRAMFAYRDFELASSRDAWVGSGFRDPTGAAGTDLGRQLEGSFVWTAVPRRLSVETGFAHLQSGSFVHAVTATDFRGSPNYVYTALFTQF